MTEPPDLQTNSQDRVGIDRETPDRPAEPSPESATTGAVCGRCGRAAGAAATRCPCGVFLKGNTSALKTGQFSEQARRGDLPEQVGLELARWRDDIVTDLGGPAELSRLTRDAIDRYVELGAIAGYLGAKLAREGVETPRGRTKAALSALLAVTAQQHRLALSIGLERRTKDANVAQRLAQMHEEPSS